MAPRNIIPRPTQGVLYLREERPFSQTAASAFGHATRT